jgi:DNA-binding NarL/FixJ family response regulator
MSMNLRSGRIRPAWLGHRAATGGANEPYAEAPRSHSRDEPSARTPGGAVVRPPIERAPAHVADRLTTRQCEVLGLMATGWSNVAIARHLVISAKAVVQHTSQIYDRLGLFADDETHRRVRAVVHYLQAVTVG